MCHSVSACPTHAHGLTIAELVAAVVQERAATITDALAIPLPVQVSMTVRASAVELEHKDRKCGAVFQFGLCLRWRVSQRERVTQPLYRSGRCATVPTECPLRTSWVILIIKKALGYIGDIARRQS